MFVLWSLLPIHRTGQDLHQVLPWHGQGDLAAGATHQTPLQLGGRVSGGDLPRRQEDSGTGEAKVGPLDVDYYLVIYFSSYRECQDLMESYYDQEMEEVGSHQGKSVHILIS